MKLSGYKFKNKLLLKVLGLVLLVIVCLVSSGCVSGMQTIGWSGVALSDGTMYVGSKEGRLVAVKSDGVRVWSEPLKTQAPSGSCMLMPSSTGSSGGGGCASASTAVAIYGTPVVYGDLAYITAYNGKVYAFNSSTLELRWIYPREDYLSALVSGVALDSGKLFFGTSDGRVIALDAATGDRQWEYQVGAKIWSTPAVDKGIVFVTCFDKKLYALDAQTGNKKWEFETGGAIEMAPLVYKDTVYFGSFDCNLYAVNAADGKEKWKFEAGEKWLWAKPVAYEDVIYAGCLDGKVYALNAVTGQEKTNFSVGPVASSPVMAGTLLIVANEKGEIYSIDTTNNGLKKLAELGVAVSAPLAASSDVVYVHTSDLNVHRVDIDTGAKLTPFSLKKE